MSLTLEDCTVARAVFLWAAKRKQMTCDGVPFTWRMHNHYMRNVIRHERWLMGCSGKHGFETYRMAEMVANRHHNDEGEGCVIYRCRFCRKFHLATRVRALRRTREMMLGKKAEREHA